MRKTLTILLFLLMTASGKSYIFVDPSLSNFPALNLNNDENTYHVFSHGRPGELFINGLWLDKEELFIFFKDKMKASKELLIYGCEFAKGQKGKEAVLYLEKKLAVKVSASTDITGFNGNWTLEQGRSLHTLKLSSYKGNLQLDNIHYLNPIVFTNYPLDITQEFVYLSTPSISNITISVNYASGTGNPRISLLDINANTSSIVTDGVITLSNSQPKRISFVNTSNTVISPGQSPITLPSVSAGTIISGNTAGLVFASADNFYVNYRGRQTNHAGTVLTKGESALGKEFRWGGTPTQNLTNTADVGNILSVMATEDDTNIEISNIKPGVEFLNGSNLTPLTGTSFYRTLQKEKHSYYMQR